MSVILSKWNLLDAAIFKIESCIKDHQEPDIEAMIEAETSYLIEENNRYKDMQYPKTILKENNDLFCPECKYKIPEDMIGKYHIKCCPECGQRIKYHKIQSAVIS